jgi:hypothetical protein
MGSEEEMYDVQEIRDKKYERGKYYYLVKWEGYSSDQNTWEPEEHLLTVPEILNKFNEQFDSGLKKKSSHRAKKMQNKIQQKKKEAKKKNDIKRNSLSELRRLNRQLDENEQGKVRDEPSVKKRLKRVEEQSVSEDSFLPDFWEDYDDIKILQTGKEASKEKELPGTKEKFKAVEIRESLPTKEKPKVPEGREVPAMKEKPKVPEGREVPAMKEKPKVLEGREVLAMKEKPKGSEVREVLAMKEKPKASEVREVPAMKEKPKAPEVREVPAMKEKPKVLEGREVPAMKEKPKGSEVREVPAMKEKPKGSEVREVPAMKEKPKASEVREVPAMKEKPKAPEIHRVEDTHKDLFDLISESAKTTSEKASEKLKQNAVVRASALERLEETNKKLKDAIFQAKEKKQSLDKPLILSQPKLVEKPKPKILSESRELFKRAPSASGFRFTHIESKGNLKYDKPVRILGCRQIGDEISYVVLFQPRMDGKIPSPSVYSQSELVHQASWLLCDYWLNNI